MGCSPESKDDLLIVRPLGGPTMKSQEFTSFRRCPPGSIWSTQPADIGDYVVRSVRDAVKLGFRSSADHFVLSSNRCRSQGVSACAVLLALKLDQSVC